MSSAAHHRVYCRELSVGWGYAVRIAIIGASAAGIFSALLLGRSGHEIVLIEQDKFAIAEDPEATARTAFRIGAPQIMQPHVILPKCRELLHKHLPDVYSSLLAAGALEAPIRSQMRPSLTDQDPRPGDERLSLLMTRRSTLDWVLRRTIATENCIQHLCGLRATGLIADGQQVHHRCEIRAMRKMKETTQQLQSG